MSDVTYVVTHNRSGDNEPRDVGEFGSENAAIGYLKGLEDVYHRLEAYRATLVRESGTVVLRAESTAPGPGGKLVTLLSRYEIVERVA